MLRSHRVHVDLDREHGEPSGGRASASFHCLSSEIGHAGRHAVQRVLGLRGIIGAEGSPRRRLIEISHADAIVSRLKLPT